MQFTTKTLVALLAAVGTQAVVLPRDDGAPRPHKVIEHLQSNGHITWTPDGNGGAHTFVPLHKVNEAKSNLTSPAPKLAVRTSWSDWRPSGIISGFTAYSHCITSGQFAITNQLGSWPSQACAKFLQSTSVGGVLDAGWDIYSSMSDQPGPKGEGQTHTYFLFERKGAKPPKLTETMCDTAYDFLTTNLCQGSGAQTGQYRGGTIRLGDDNSGAVHISLDAMRSTDHNPLGDYQ